MLGVSEAGCLNVVEVEVGGWVGGQGKLPWGHNLGMNQEGEERALNKRNSLCKGQAGIKAKWRTEGVLEERGNQAGDEAGVLEGSQALLGSAGEKVFWYWDQQKIIGTFVGF